MAGLATVTATYGDIHTVVSAVRSMREEGCKEIQVFGPIMEQELEDAIGKPPSPVRRYALIGGLTGCISGFALTVWSSYYYPLVVGGKALASTPPASASITASPRSSGSSPQRNDTTKRSAASGSAT